jgi:hypothetical protein
LRRSREGEERVKRALQPRDRQLLGVGLRIYETLAKRTKSDLEALALPSLHVDTAIGNIGVIRERLATTSLEVEFQEDLRVTTMDVLSLLENRVVKVKHDEEKLTIPTSDVDRTEEEVSSLRSAFSHQLTLEFTAS